MKKKLMLVASLLMIVGITLTGCTFKEQPREAALNFKAEYESLNDKTTSSGKEYRKLNIDDDNPFIKVTPKDIVDKIKNGETFYLYVGDSMCPWCRSNVETAIKVAKNKGIKDIYYIDIWDDNHTEILRDVYELKSDKKDMKVVKTKDGIDEYEFLLDTFKDVLRDYELTDKETGKTYSTGEKRIYAPNYFYIKDGKAVKMESGKADGLTSAYDELTEEILKDQENKFNEFFN